MRTTTREKSVSSKKERPPVKWEMRVRLRTESVAKETAAFPKSREYFGVDITIPICKSKEVVQSGTRQRRKGLQRRTARHQRHPKERVHHLLKN